MAPKAMQALIGSELSAESFEKAKEAILSEMKLPEGVPGGQAAYRMTLAASFLHKFFLCILAELKTDAEKIKYDPTLFSGELPAVPDEDNLEVSGTNNFLEAEKPNFFGQQRYPAPKVVSQGLEEKDIPLDDEQKETEASAVGKPVTHQSGPLHCTGEAIYADDIVSVRMLRLAWLLRLGKLLLVPQIMA